MRKLLLKINAWIHLWLGLSSGLVVFILGITGCILVFEEEIEQLTQPYRFIEETVTTWPSPEDVQQAFLKQESDAHVLAIAYPGPRQAVNLRYKSAEGENFIAYLHPESGKIIAKLPDRPDFFRIMLLLHIHLLLPGNVGTAIISYATVVFIVLLFSGLILWWPRKWKKTRLKKHFAVKWNGGRKRLNYDLHNVYGFYMFIPSLVLALTGIFISLPWFTKGVYWATTGGKPLPPRETPVSDTAFISALPPIAAAEKVWNKLDPGIKDGQAAMQLLLPQRTDDVLTLVLNPAPGSASKMVMQYYDRYTLQPIEMPHYWQKAYEESNAGDLIGRYNFDIHVGRIGGLPGKLLAFIASLICTSLPITGFMIWYNRRWGKKRRKARRHSRLLRH